MKRRAAALATAAALGAAGCGGGPSLPANAPPGARTFVNQSCGSCHTLRAVGASGTVGGNLDRRRPDAATVERWVRKGGNGMPAFGSRLSDAQIRELATWVASASRSGR